MAEKFKKVGLITGQASDVSLYNKNAFLLRGVEGCDLGPVINGDRNTIISASGSEFLTSRYLQRAPFGGATSAAAENIAHSVDHVNSQPGSMTLVILSIPGVKGNLFAWTSNGNNDITTQVLFAGQANPRQFLGHQGHVVSVYQELWGGKAPVSRAGTPYIAGHYE